MSSPSVAVITYPHVYTTLIARLLRDHGGYRVHAPDVAGGSWEPAQQFDVVIASLPVPRSWGHIFVELPLDFADPIVVSIGNVTVQLDVSPRHPIEDIVGIIDRLDLDRASETAPVTLIAMATEATSGD